MENDVNKIISIIAEHLYKKNRYFSKFSIEQQNILLPLLIKQYKEELTKEKYIDEGISVEEVLKTVDKTIFEIYLDINGGI